MFVFMIYLPCVMPPPQCPSSLYEDPNSLSDSEIQLQLAANWKQRKEEARIAKERKELAWRRDHAYDDVMTEENLEQNTNENRDENFLDDFM
jgi:hypothetical protein